MGVGNCRILPSTFLRIGAQESEKYKQCGTETDSAQHTVDECPNFAAQRVTPVRKIGKGISPAALVKTHKERLLSLSAKK